MDEYIRKIGNPIKIGIIDNTILSIQENLQKTLSQQSYDNVETVLKPILTVCIILLPIYIIYSILYFIYSFLFKKRIKIKLLIPIALTTILFYIAYVAYLTFYIY